MIVVSWIETESHKFNICIRKRPIGIESPDYLSPYLDLSRSLMFALWNFSPNAILL